MAGSERQENIEILRGLAAFSVMWFHLTNGSPTFIVGDSPLKASGAYGYLGVQLFFVISGFIIPYSLSLRNYRIASDGLGFLARRIVRIEPAYLASAILIVALQVASSFVPSSHEPKPDLGLATSLALHVAYLAPWFNVPWLSPVYWSLAIEFQYYLAMLFFSPLLLSKRRSNVYLFLIATAALSLTIHNEQTLFQYLPLFGIGFVRFLATRRVLNVAELSMWAVIFFGLTWFVLDPDQALAAAFAFGFLFLPIKKPVPILSFLGAISYSLYLIHVPIGGRIINFSVHFPSTPTVQLVAVLIATAASLLCAYCFWWLIEKPSAKLSKAIGSRQGHLTYSAATSPQSAQIATDATSAVDLV